MELWIKTQNKNELLKVEDLCVEYNGSLDPELHPYRIIAKIDGEEIKLGIYEDEERALEVLDEIQSLMKPKFLAKEIDKPLTGKKIDIEVFPYGTIIYEMPLN